MAKVELSVKIKAPAEAVWEVVSDHERMGEWGKPLKRVSLIKEGSPARNGIGAVRELIAPGQKINEEITGWDPPRSYSYILLNGAPVKDHHGKMVVIPDPNGCEVRWTVEFAPTIPLTGAAITLLLNVVFQRMLNGLKKHCEA